MKERVEGSPERWKSPPWMILRASAGAASFLVMISALWSLLRWIASLALPGFGLLPRLYVRELAVYAASLLVFGIAVGIVGMVLSRGKRHDHFSELSAALRKIARGDFDVAVRIVGDVRNNPLGQVAGELNDMARSLKRMEELRQEFISTVSHDIQSPLTSIAGFTRNAP